jgi:hypothetical protein
LNYYHQRFKNPATNSIETHDCFGSLLYYRSNINTIYVNKNLESVNHKLVLSDKQIRTWLRIVKYYFGMISSIKETNEYYEITINDDLRKVGSVHFSRLIVATCIRYLYENPFSLILKHAFEMKEKYNTYSLMSWVLIMHAWEAYTNEHCIIDTFKGVDGKELIHVLKTFDIRKLKNLPIEGRYGNNTYFSRMPNITGDELTKLKNILINEGFLYKGRQSLL